MEAQEKFVGSNVLMNVIKGKRTKRQRSSSPYKARMTSSSSSYCSGDEDGDIGLVVEEMRSISPLTTSSEVYERTEEEEEEDMANCLILLAQGDGPSQITKINTRQFSNLPASATNYECKTCNRTFPSFQALGGHRASHKKPKPTIEEKEISPIDLEDCQWNKISSVDPPISLQILSVNTTNNKGFLGNNKAKIHECQICGSEFTSGQALGGHMRRHRANTTSHVATNSVDTTSDGEIKPRNYVFSLDLNLPAPMEDDRHHSSHHESKLHHFVSTSKQQALVFSAPALVDCHY